jgi:hypothetical protein
MEFNFLFYSALYMLPCLNSPVMLKTKVILMLRDPDTHKYKTSYISRSRSASKRYRCATHPHPVGKDDFLLGELLVEGVLGQRHHLDTPPTACLKGQSCVIFRLSYSYWQYRSGSGRRKIGKKLTLFTMNLIPNLTIAYKYIKNSVR